ncbi:MAG TPA: hypothetical protein VMU69_08480 [Bradyrhizobium sp.]|nr:hypothetical protein [Bradyrhizobium sp.]
MSKELIPETVRDLIVRHIDSVAQLEALLFLHARSSEQWDVASVAKRLYAPPSDMATALAGLADHGFLELDDERYRYARRSDRDASVEALAEAYAHYLIPITNLIHSKPRNIRAFSDAFRLRKD